MITSTSSSAFMTERADIGHSSILLLGTPKGGCHG